MFKIGGSSDDNAGGVYLCARACLRGRMVCVCVYSCKILWMWFPPMIAFIATAYVYVFI